MFTVPQVLHVILLVIFAIIQGLYLFSLLVTLWFHTRPADTVEVSAEPPEPGTPLPTIILFYPVLRELEETMRTTFLGMEHAKYPPELLRVISIPNADDEQSISALHRLQQEFSWLEVMPVPPTTDPSWRAVWSSWDMNAKAYWWHVGKRAGDSALPPKKTRQLIWAMYQTAPGNEDTLLSYIDADSVVPRSYWYGAAKASQTYDVVQFTNITGNLLSTWPTSFYGMDHISWDSTLYKRMTAHGKHPFYVLGKGLFFRYRDLLESGGFHPWLTIEDPEVGMRLWTNGARLGVVEDPLVEEVPATWSQGVLQRKRWVAGFFQSLSSPLVHMGMRPLARMRARLNFVPCLSLMINPIGFVVGIYVLVRAALSPERFVPVGLEVLALVTFALAVGVLIFGWIRSWTATRQVLPARKDRLRYSLRVNPIFLLVYWLWWIAPLVKGFGMFLTDRGLVWERTEKIDANHGLIRGSAQAPALPGSPAEEESFLRAVGLSDAEAEHEPKH